MRQATEGNFIRKFFLVRGSLGPGMKNKDGIEDYIVYVPKHFEEAEKTSPKVKKFVEAYKAFYKRDFPYDQAPLCSSSCYDHVYMLVEAMKKAGTVERCEQDPRGAALHAPTMVCGRSSTTSTASRSSTSTSLHLKKGGTIQMHARRSALGGTDTPRRQKVLVRSMTQVILGQILNGIIVGTLYGIIALGVTLTFGITGIVNFALGEFMMIGAYATWHLTDIRDLPYPIAVVLAVLIARPGRVLSDQGAVPASPATISSTASWFPSA